MCFLFERDTTPSIMNTCPWMNCIQRYATSWPMESSMWTDPHDRVQTQPTRFTSRLIWMLVTDTKWGLEPQILRWQTSTIRITPQRLAISGPNLCPVTEHRGWVVWPPHLLPRHSIITLHSTNGGICIMCVHSNQRRSMVTHYKVGSRHSTPTLRKA